GLWLLGWLRIRRRGSSSAMGWMSGVLGRLLQKGSNLSVLGIGLMNGLLPCGLVYAMLATAAATGTPLRGALTMGVFGLSTIPALVILSLTTRFAGVRWRTRVNQLAGVLVIIFGILTVLHGVSAGHGGMHE